ncbi:hypothetical protein NX784_10635 [Massilia pinisoli]|uniref:Uncharacterized protein n=1 Tax=Massilia pinisoli TaxID=1772194 RepID=A0ABT1ZQ64_9BURK|nr:hypothetical protein [Massilia pinisoli]MCS0582047.1 hypothetical protein [Massilia pinisoli]
MIVFLDTEYTDPINTDLISIGMVSEDGQRVVYLERSDYQIAWCNKFVREAVLPQLGRCGPAVTRAELAVRLTAWFATLPRKVVIACDSRTDWILLLDAMNNAPPHNLVGQPFDLRSLIDSSIFHRAVVRYHEQHGPWHHARHDAHAHRAGWMAWMDARKGKSRAMQGKFHCASDFDES